jgi:hypothetical protein
MDEDKELKLGIIGRIRRDFGFRLKIVSYVVGTVVAIIVVATAVMSVLVWLSSASLADRLAGIGAIFAGMSLLLTVFAAVVAYLAFWVSIGLPDLKLQVRFGPSPPNRFSFTAKRQNGWPESGWAGDAWPESGWLEAKDSAETAVVICFRNVGTYAAKAPAVIVQLEGMEFVGDVLALNADGWTVNERSETGLRAVQWEGGADHSVYTNLVRELPVLHLAGLRTIPGWTGHWEGPVQHPHGERPYPWIVVSILTDIFRRDSWQSVDFIVDGKSQFPSEKKIPEWI